MMSLIRRSSLVAFVCVALLSVAHAAPTEEELAQAKQFFDTGVELFDEGKYERAIEAWEKAFELSQYPDIQYSLSSAYEKIAKFQEAIDALDRYRVYAPPEESSTLKSKRDSLYRRLEEQRAQAAATPAPVVTPAPTTTVEPAATTSSTAVVVPKEKRSPLPVVLIAAGGAGLATGGIFLAQAAGARGNYTDLCADTERGLLCPLEAQADLDRFESAGTIGVISAGVGGALVVTGAILAATSKPSKAADLRILPSSDGQRHSLWLQGRFH